MKFLVEGRGGRERGAGVRSGSVEGDGGSGSVGGVTGRRGEEGGGESGRRVAVRRWWRSGVVEAVPEKMERSV